MLHNNPQSDVHIPPKKKQVQKSHQHKQTFYQDEWLPWAPKTYIFRGFYGK